MALTDAAYSGVPATANVKQVLTILLAMSVFHLPVGLTNSVGIALTLAGGAWYGSLGYKSKRERMRLTMLQ